MSNTHVSNVLKLQHLPPQIRKKKSSGQQKKEELEREVGVLCKMLDHEQKVHEFLERVQHQDKGSIIGIPNFIPPKVKELLAELAMVESEIVRLESQISQLQSDMNHEMQLTTQLKSKQHLSPNDNHNPNPKLLSFQTDSKEDKTEVKEKKVAFESTKTLHFITKAIKGDYNLSDFSISGKSLSSKGITYQKEDEPESESNRGNNKGNKKIGVLKPPSPLRDQRKPTPWRERNHDNQPDHQQKPIYVSPIQTEEENIQNLSPNKLSESIMKCLIFIYVRLLRTSRAIELEKSGPISRSASFSMSFRATEPSLNSKTTLLLHKDSRQSDPYGIFNMEDSIARDIGPYKNLVRFTSGSMDPKCVSNSSSIPLFEKLKVLLNSLQKVDLTHMSYQQKLAFWINIYNACVMHAFLQNGVPENFSPEKLIALLNKATLNIGGNTITAKGIECFILRNPESSSTKKVLENGDKDSIEAIAQYRYRIEPSNTNVAFALCCGTRSSPAVKIYTQDGVISELEKSKLEYLQASIVVTGNTKRIAIPELLLQHMNDFAQDLESLIEWLLTQLPTSGSLRKSLVRCFKSNNADGTKASAIVDRIPYDFEFQYLLAA